MTNTIYQGDALTVLRTLPDNSVQCCVTSPPYYNLRDYGIEGQIGLEATPRDYIEKLVHVFREVRRVLKSDGVCWLNLGDSFAGNRGNTVDRPGYDNKSTGNGANLHFAAKKIGGEFKNKDLMMIPARVSIALCDDGWYLRQDVIWNKSNAMPESVTDRPTSSHEHVFLLAKSERYFYDAQAIAEPSVSAHASGNGFARDSRLSFKNADGTARGNMEQWQVAPTRNKRDVWTVNSHPYSAAHFATMPPKLVEPCILAGTSPQACEVCGAPWQRVTEREGITVSRGNQDFRLHRGVGRHDGGVDRDLPSGYTPTSITVGWQPTCTCINDGSGKCVVIDPFAGAGTVPMVALQHGRQYIGIELNPDYISLAEKRISVIQPVLWSCEEAS